MSGAIGFFQIGISPIGGTIPSPSGGGGAHYLIINSAGAWGFTPDWIRSPFNLSYTIEVPNGVTASYSLQYTIDDVNDPLWTPVWLPDPTHGGNLVTSAGGNFRWPIRALLLNVVSITGGNMRFVIMQGSTAR